MNWINKIFACSVVVACLAGPVSPASAVVGDCVAGSDWGTVRQDLTPRVVALVNEHRASKGLVQVESTVSLTDAGLWKSRHMARYGYFSHSDPAPPVARTAGERLEACNYPSGRYGWGENIANGYSTPEAVMQAWLNSSGHRANIENPSFRAIGVGAAANSNGRIYWTQEFGTLVQAPLPNPAYVCSNGNDDDSDGLVDFPADPGCSASSDTDEANTPSAATVTLSPGSVTFVTGQLRSGSYANLKADDNSFLKVRHANRVTNWYGRMTDVPNSLASLAIGFKGKNSALCNQSVGVWDWTSKAWVWLDTRPVGTTEAGITVSPAGTLADYVSGTSGNGDVTVGVRCSADTAFTAVADLMQITFQPL